MPNAQNQKTTPHQVRKHSITVERSNMAQLELLFSLCLSNIARVTSGFPCRPNRLWDVIFTWTKESEVSPVMMFELYHLVAETAY